MRLALLRRVNARASSLRIARLTIGNFRTFVGPTEIELAPQGGGGADEMPVFHGGNGSGKSNALAALDLFFRASLHWMMARPDQGSDDLWHPWNFRHPTTGLLVSPRDWPPGVREPMEISVLFDAAKTPFTVRIVQAGNQAVLRMEGVWAPGGIEIPSPPARLDAAATQYLQSIRNQFETPYGLGSKPFFRLDARRRDFRFIGEGEPLPEAPASPLSQALAERLLLLATSLDPGDTERWRAFAALIGRFKTLQGREVSVVQAPGVGVDLRFEARGRQILRVSELSSGEQQVVALAAAVLTSRAAVVAIEEPEISLHPDNQELVRDFLREQVRNGLVDQIILESHVPTFDGPEVIRFSRSPEGVTSVLRQPSAANDEIRATARAAGAEEQWVTPEGYTRLPEEMRSSLGLQTGGHLWFLRSTEQRRWEAWTAGELDQAFGLPGATPKG